MLMQFSIGNFRLFKEKVILNLEASTDNEHDENIFSPSENLRLLKTEALYGPNASGKSNLFMAMAFMRNFIFDSSNAQITSKILVESFKLNNTTEHAPSHFETDL